MGRRRQTANDNRKQIFDCEYRMFKAMLGMGDGEAAEYIGVTPRTMTRRKQSPWEFRADELCKIMVTWPDGAILAFVKGEKYEQGKGIA